jgi:hypothetical protein
MKKMKQLDISTMKLTPLQKEYYKQNPTEQVWGNEKYIVHVRRDIETGFFKGGEMTHLSIRRNDRRAMTDWRDFQWIKNDIVGEQNEGIEIFPAENRLVDGANQFHLWVFQDDTIRVPVGFSDRSVSDNCLMGETQRKFPESRKPSDLDEHNERIRKTKENFDKTGKVSWTD